jgi:hypothetical protein
MKNAFLAVIMDISKQQKTISAGFCVNDGAVGVLGAKKYKYSGIQFFSSKSVFLDLKFLSIGN